MLRRTLDPDFNRPNALSLGYQFLRRGPNIAVNGVGPVTNSIFAENANFNVDNCPSNPPLWVARITPSTKIPSAMSVQICFIASPTICSSMSAPPTMYLTAAFLVFAPSPNSCPFVSVGPLPLVSIVRSIPPRHLSASISVYSDWAIPRVRLSEVRRPSPQVFFCASWRRIIFLGFDHT